MAETGLLLLEQFLANTSYHYVRYYIADHALQCKPLGRRVRAIRFSENVVADIREWTSTWGRRALDFGGRAGYHDFNQI